MDARHSLMELLEGLHDPRCARVSGTQRRSRFWVACAWSCCLVRAWSRPCLRELASKMRPSFVIMAWFYARPTCKQGRSHGCTVFGSLARASAKRAQRRAKRAESLSGSMRQFVTPQVWKQVKHAAKQHGCRDRTRWTLQPLILIAAIMTWCAGETDADRFVLSRAFYVQIHAPKRQRPGKTFSGFCEAMLRLPMPVWWAFCDAVRSRVSTSWPTA